MLNSVQWCLFTSRERNQLGLVLASSSETVAAEWEVFVKENPGGSGLLFVGESLPRIEGVLRIFSSGDAGLMLTEAARWLMASRYRVIEPATGSLPFEGTIPGMAVYRVVRTTETSVNSGIETLPRIPELETPRLPIVRTAQQNFEEWQADPFQIAKRAPAWVLPVKIHSLPSLTVRCANVLRNQAIVTVGDLRQYNQMEASDWPNFGRKSMADLAEVLMKLLNSNDGGAELVTEESGRQELSAPAPVVYATLVEHIDEMMANLVPIENRVFRGRFAVDGSLQTLGDIGVEFGVSRERVRQIEARMVDRLRLQQPWISRLGDELQSLLENRSAPLYFADLPRENPWFIGIMERAALFEQLLERLVTNPQLHLLHLEDRSLVSRLNLEQWQSLVAKSLDEIRQVFPQAVTRSQVNDILQKRAAAENCPELSELLREYLCDRLLFGTAQDGKTDILLAFGRGVAVQLLAILENSDRPLHFEELCARYNESSDEAMSPRNVHAAIDRSNAMRFGPGTYGTWRHFPLTQDQQSEVLREAEQITGVAAQPARQWHCVEILAELQSRRPDLPEEIDKYLLEIILSRSSVLTSVGRQVWMNRFATPESTADRVAISEICKKALEEAGRPLTSSELKAAIHASRGVSEYFLPQADEILVRVAPNTWGLAHRDFGISLQDQDALADAIVNRLRQRDRGLHIDEIRSDVSPYVFVPAHLSDYMLMSLGRRDPRIALCRGQYLALSEWGESRRLTIAEALDELGVSLQQPISMADIRKMLSDATERNLSGQDVINPICQAGFRFNHESQLWEPPSPNRAADSDPTV